MFADQDTAFVAGADKPGLDRALGAKAAIGVTVVSGSGQRRYRAGGDQPFHEAGGRVTLPLGWPFGEFADHAVKVLFADGFLFGSHIKGHNGPTFLYFFIRICFVFRISCFGFFQVTRYSCLFPASRATKLQESVDACPAARTRRGQRQQGQHFDDVLVDEEIMSLGFRTFR